MALTKANIVESVHHNLRLPKSNSVQLVESLLEVIKRTLASGEDLLISEFGKILCKGQSEAQRKEPSDWRRYDAGVEAGSYFQVLWGFEGEGEWA